MRCGESLPINLGLVAAARLVNRIEFRQLFTEGGLALTDKGFVIYVRCDAGEADDFTERIAEDGTGSTLPEKTVHRARFTIAHEIAHTLFYDDRASPPRMKFDVSDLGASQALEYACNEVAAAILLPEAVIERRWREVDLADPRELRRLAHDALVSAPTVVRRLHQLRHVSHPEVLVASAAYRDDTWIITAVSRHYSLRNVFPKGKAGSSVADLVDHPDFALLGGQMRDVAVEYMGHGGQPVLMEFTCESQSTPGRGKTSFIIGRPRTPE